MNSNKINNGPAVTSNTVIQLSRIQSILDRFTYLLDDLGVHTDSVEQATYKLLDEGVVQSDSGAKVGAVAYANGHLATLDRLLDRLVDYTHRLSDSTNLLHSYL